MACSLSWTDIYGTFWQPQFRSISRTARTFFDLVIVNGMPVAGVVHYWSEAERIVRRHFGTGLMGDVMAFGTLVVGVADISVTRFLWSVLTGRSV